MIEKLEELDIETFPIGDSGAQLLTMLAHINETKRKINELVDAVNELKKDYDNVCIWVGKQKLKTPAENVQDKFAEQRNWIGCLCRFWFDNKKQADIGILGDIDEDEIHPYFNADLGHNYKCCEPVKPDDDIIYKGGDNE